MSGRLTWERGSPMRGALGGLLIGLGATLILTQFSVVALSMGALVLGMAIGAVVGAFRGWWGTPFREDTAPPAPAPGSEPPPPPPPPPA